MARTRWLDEREARAWRGYRRMRDLLDLQITRDLARQGLSDADYTVLVVLSEAPDNRVRQIDLARRILWSKSRLSHQLSRMERRGLVRREGHPQNARAIDAVLTPKGRRTIEATAPGHVTSVRTHFIDLLSDEQLDAIADATESVVDHLRSLDNPGGAST